MPTKKKSVNIYLDHAATSKIDTQIYKKMQPFLTDEFGNPSALHTLGRNAGQAINQARLRVAHILNTSSDSIIFTGSGTESDNLAIIGAAEQNKTAGNHIITSRIEHPAVLEPCRRLEKQGFEITYLDPDENGLISVKTMRQALRPDTILISIMYANNEIGTIEPIAAIGKEILKWRKENNSSYPYFHTDACQAAAALDLNTEKLHADLVTLNGSKIYGPKGVGVLYKRRGIEIYPLVLGGGQEFGLRAGTQNVAAIVGLAHALKKVQTEKHNENERLNNLTGYFFKQLQQTITGITLNGPGLDIGLRLPNNLNVSIQGVEGEALVLYLDEYGIACSTGSACSSGSLEPSHVLSACGIEAARAHSSLRFTLGKENNREQIDYVVKNLFQIVEKLRGISPQTKHI